MGKHACTVVHNLQEKKRSIPRGLRSPAANAARLYLFSLGETELVSFILCYLLISYSGTQSGGLACARQQGRKTIHHGDSKDKHIYTCIHLGFFSPGPTRASPFFSLPSTFLRLSLHFISVICCTYIKWVVFYNNWFCPPPPILLRTTSTVTDECIFFCVMVCVTKGELIRNVAQQLFIQFSLPYSSVVDNIDVLRV